MPSLYIRPDKLTLISGAGSWQTTQHHGIRQQCGSCESFAEQGRISTRGVSASSKSCEPYAHCMVSSSSVSCKHANSRPLPLQLCLRHTGVRNLKVWRVENAQLELQFERRTSGILCLESWVNVGALESYNKIQDVCSRGYYLPEDGSGLKLKTGHVAIEHPPAGEYCAAPGRACDAFCAKFRRRGHPPNGAEQNRSWPIICFG